MSITSSAKALLKSESVQECSADLLADAIGALLGDPAALAHIIYDVQHLSATIQHQIFFKKFMAFIEGIDASGRTADCLAEKLSENGSAEDNAMRIVSCIDHCNCQRKIQYIINVTNSLLAGHITRERYFRICNAITGTLLEDLVFLRNHMGEIELSDCESVQGLAVSGLMYQSTVSEEPTYSFTPLARQVDIWAISHNDLERYPNPLRASKMPCNVQVNIDGGTFHGLTWEDLSRG